MLCPPHHITTTQTTTRIHHYNRYCYNPHTLIWIINLILFTLCYTQHYTFNQTKFYITTHHIVLYHNKHLVIMGLLSPLLTHERLRVTLHSWQTEYYISLMMDCAFCFTLMNWGFHFTQDWFYITPHSKWIVHHPLMSFLSFLINDGSNVNLHLSPLVVWVPLVNPMMKKIISFSVVADGGDRVSNGRMSEICNNVL